MFYFSARIPFVTVRPWTPNLSTLTFAMKKNPFYANQALPFNIYAGSTTFGAYDTLGNDFTKVRLVRGDAPLSTFCAFAFRIFTLRI